MKSGICIPAILVALTLGPIMADNRPRALFEALRNGEWASVKKAVEEGDDVKIVDERGNTLLMETAVFGNASNLEFLLAHGASVNATNQTGHTALMRAIPDLSKIRVLLEHGADIRGVTSDGSTALMIAARLPAASEIVGYLLAHGAEINPANRRGLDAVMMAAEQGAADNLRILLDAGARGEARIQNVVLKDRPGSIVFSGPSLEIVRRRAEGLTALMNAARAGCYPCVRLLLQHGSDARAGTEAGYTALHAAAYQGDPAMMIALLDAGAPVNVADDRGLTPLMMSVNSRTKDVTAVQILLDRGAEAQARDSLGRSAADWAAIGGRKEIMAIIPGPRLPRSAAAPASGQTNSGQVGGAVEKSISLLRETAPKFFPKAGCVSCHNVSIPMIALQEQERRGSASHITQAAIQQMAKQTIASLSPVSENLLSGYCTVPGVVTTASWALISLHGAGHSADRLTDSVVRCLMAEQLPTGQWGHGGGERPPLSPEGGIPGTALVARAIQLYAPPALAAEAKRRIASARAYLVSERPRAGDDYAFRLLGLFWAGGAEAEMANAASELLRQQRPEGGWAQTVDLPPDAYATGQALAAISMAQPWLVQSEAYRQGVAYLMRAREADGSWHVRSRAFGFQPYFESGFPHGPDQWISMAATAWSAIALMPAVQPSQTGSR